jgi:hypothetical protein
VDDKLRAMARQAIADTEPNASGGVKMRAIKLLWERTGKTERLQDCVAAVQSALDRPAADLPIDSIVARTHVVYIKTGPLWHSTNGSTHTDADIDRYLTENRTRVLRVGTGED